MKRIVFAMRRLITFLILVAALGAGGVLGLSKMRADSLPPLNPPNMGGYVDYIGERAAQMKRYIVAQYRSHFQEHKGEHHQENQKIVVTSPKAMDVTVTQQFVCQIRSQRHIEVCALDGGYLEEISVNEGQAVKKGDVMFRILPVLYKAKLDAELAEARLAQLEYNNTDSCSRTKSSLRMRCRCSRPNLTRPRPRRTWRRRN